MTSIHQGCSYISDSTSYPLTTKLVTSTANLIVSSPCKSGRLRQGVIYVFDARLAISVPYQFSVRVQQTHRLSGSTKRSLPTPNRPTASVGGPSHFLMRGRGRSSIPTGRGSPGPDQHRRWTCWTPARPCRTACAAARRWSHWPRSRRQRRRRRAPGSACEGVGLPV